MILDVPVDPDAAEAREWLVRELAKPPYRAAEPNWFDRLVSSFWDWLSGLLGSGIGGPPSLLWGLVLLVVVAAVVAAYFIFGPPKLNRRSAVPGTLFGENDSRGADAMREASVRAAAAGEWSLAIEEMFRSIARGLSERAVLTTTPGTTASGFATRAREFFPDLGEELAASATLFDRVRYLGHPGSDDGYRRVSQLERDLRFQKPRFETSIETVGAAG